MNSIEVEHNIEIIRADTGKTELVVVPGTYNKEGSGGPSFGNDNDKGMLGLYAQLDCRTIELTHVLIDNREYDCYLDEEGLYKEGGPIINYKASQLQRDWCKQEGRVQMSPLVGDVAIDIGLTVESTEQVSKFIEDQNERQDNTAQA